MPLLLLSEMVDGQEGVFFALLAAKEALTTRDGRPYFKVTFRDAAREVTCPIWDDSAWYEKCRQEWRSGVFYKLQAVYQETRYGPQLEIRKIREVVEADKQDGFDPDMCLPRSQFDPAAMYEELVEIADAEIADAGLRSLVQWPLSQYREAWLRFPAAQHHHHAYVAGLLEHVLCVTRTALYLADAYASYYPNLQPPLTRDLVVAGAILHDIGKLRELNPQPTETALTAEGGLIGHVLLGRDMVQEAAAALQAKKVPLAPKLLLRLEHLIISHQRLPEWGAPKPPMTPEALLVHYADDLDAKFHMMVMALAEDKNPGLFTSAKNLLQHRIYRGS